MILQWIALLFIASSPVISPIADVQASPLSWSGEASYYSRKGCLGCSKNMIMANGQALDDSRLTIAMPTGVVRKYKLLNTRVTVRNITTGDRVSAIVTDTGGFAKYGRVADLSVAVKRAVRCGDLCQVEIVAE
jgi:rare lipoprotein A (peptidoglycan hydrolase)